MLAAFPRMGNIDKLLSDLLDRLGIEYILPPVNSEKTLSLGAKYAPEFSCLPLKLNIGNFIEALELGADTLIMAGGRGPCRFGYYAEIEKRILKDAGYDFQMITIEPPSMGFSKFVGPIKKASGKSTRKIWRALKESFPKARAFDQLEKLVIGTRCYEVETGATTKAYKKGLKLLSNITGPDEVEGYLSAAVALLDQVEKDLDRTVLKVGIIGEFFILLEPFANLDIEEWLGNRDVYLERSVYVTDWIGPTANNPVGGVSDANLAALAKNYLSHFVGGEGLASVGHTIHYANEGFDGIVHLFPFTCMPETIAKAILPSVSRDIDISIIHFTIDEQTGKAGVTTRLEAFLDLLWSQKKQRDKQQRDVKIQDYV